MDVEQDYFISQKKLWKPRALGMNRDPTASFNSWNNMCYQFPPQYRYPNSQWHPSTQPTMQYPTLWIAWPPQPNQSTPWPPGWRIPYPLYQQPHLQLPPNVVPNNVPLQPQLPAQPNPNPNNKEVQ